MLLVCIYASLIGANCANGGTFIFFLLVLDKKCFVVRCANLPLIKMEVSRKSFPIKLQNASNWSIDCDILINGISAISEQLHPRHICRRLFVTEGLLKHLRCVVEWRAEVWTHPEASWIGGWRHDRHEEEDEEEARTVVEKGAGEEVSDLIY